MTTDTPDQLKEQTLERLVDQLLALAGRQPVLHIFEDAHWADPSTLEALEQLIDRAQAAQVLTIITCRPEFEPPWHRHTHLTSLSLNRLSHTQSRTMVESVTVGKGVPPEVVSEVVAKTDGIPLFVEELTKSVLESELLENTGLGSERFRSSPSLEIPTTLQDSLMARLDRLEEVKEIAQSPTRNSMFDNSTLRAAL